MKKILELLFKLLLFSIFVFCFIKLLGWRSDNQKTKEVLNDIEQNVSVNEEEDNSIPLLKHDEKKRELEMECLMLNNSNILKESLSQLSVKDSEKWEITKESKYLKILQDSFDEVYPLFYLNNEQSPLSMISYFFHKP